MAVGTDREVFAAGSVLRSTGSPVGAVAAFNGSRWTVTRVPPPPGDQGIWFTAMDATPHVAIAVGAGLHTARGSTTLRDPYAIRFGGGDWRVIAFPSLSPSDALTDVRATSDGSIWIAVTDANGASVFRLGGGTRRFKRVPAMRSIAALAPSGRSGITAIGSAPAGSPTPPTFRIETLRANRWVAGSSPTVDTNTAILPTDADAVAGTLEIVGHSWANDDADAMLATLIDRRWTFADVGGSTAEEISMISSSEAWIAQAGPTSLLHVQGGVLQRVRLDANRFVEAITVDHAEVSSVWVGGWLSTPTGWSGAMFHSC